MKVYSVTEFRQEMNDFFGQVNVAIQGEVSGFNISQNRFVWFSLVDDNTSIDCFMMKFQLKQPLEDGMEIRAVGSPTLFKKGKFTFRPRQIDLVGEGSLRQAFEALKKKLEQEGLFEESRKRSLPRFPEKIGIVTSKDAAAYTDVLRILKNRWAGLDIRHRHVNVQGARAVSSIVDALTELNEEHKDLDCIILTRGGGSLEDLQAFNSEEVARAVFASNIPVVSGVGHERDVTLTDMVADVRASTPSNAAELVVSNKDDVLSEISHMIERCERGCHNIVQEMSDSVYCAINVLDDRSRATLDLFKEMDIKLRLQFFQYASTIALKKERLGHLSQILQATNPLNVLKRGFSMTADEQGKIIRSVSQLKAGQGIVTKMADGQVHSEVHKVNKK